MVQFSKDYWLLILEKAIKEGISDIHLHEGEKIFLRKNGDLFCLHDVILHKKDIELVLKDVLSANQWEIFTRTRSVDFAYTLEGQRLRGNLFSKRQRLALVLRLINKKIPKLRDLHQTNILQSMVFANEGLILVTGRTASGKTTTVTAFIDEINERRHAHILTLEDPLEYLHVSKKSLVSQREFQVDFFDFATALKSALREDPDIIFIGELRDANTISIALSAAQTGHLVLATLHSTSVVDVLPRLESFFPKSEQGKIRLELATSLKLIITQQILQGNEERVCADEILIATPAIKNLLRLGKIEQLKSMLRLGKEDGMQTMEQAVEDLYRAGKISEKTAFLYLDNTKNG